MLSAFESRGGHYLFDAAEQNRNSDLSYVLSTGRDWTLPPEEYPLVVR